MKAALRALATAVTDAPWEVIFLAAGIALRISMAWSYDVTTGYDYDDHLGYVQWLVGHRSLPDIHLNNTAYHPPLYYAVAAALRSMGVQPTRLVWISIASGCLRLLVLFVAVRWFLPGDRLARCATLALAAVLPASVHLDGMVSNEGLNNLFAIVATALGATMFRAEGRTRWRWGAALGVALGLGLLTKVSSLAVLAAIGLAGILEALRRDGAAWRCRLGRVVPVVGALAIAFAVSGWFFAHQESRYGKAMPTAFDAQARASVAGMHDVPYFSRRPASYFFGWTAEIFRSPYYPIAIVPRSYALPVLVASTFVDYYSYGFSRSPPLGEPGAQRSWRRVGASSLVLSRGSVLGGTLIALAVVAAWLVVFWKSWRGRKTDALAVLFVPAFAVLGQLHFSVLYPADSMGPIKGVYLQFAAPALYVLFGLAVSHSAHRRLGVPFGIALGLAWLAVGAYTVHSRIL